MFTPATEIPVVDTHPDERPHNLRTVTLVLVCGIVLLFRVAAWLNPSSYVVIPEPLRLPTNGLGVLFLVCSLWAWRLYPSNVTRVFLVCGLGGAVHWGGTIATGNTQVDIALLVFYVAMTAMGDGAFLDLALRYPGARASGADDVRPRLQRVPVLSFYVLAILSFAALPIAPFVPQRFLEAGLGFAIGMAFVMSVVGGIVFLVKWVLATPAQRREYFLTPIVGVLVLASALDLLAKAGVLPGQPEAWTLTYGLEPMTLAWGLTRLRNRRASHRVAGEPHLQ